MTPDKLRALAAEDPLKIADIIWRAAHRKGPGFFVTHVRQNSALRDLFHVGWPQYEQKRQGQVYLCTHPMQAGKTKIGCTRKGVGSRMRSLRSAGILEDFEVLHCVDHFDAHGLEARLHQFFGPRRIDREWFKLDRDMAKVLLDRYAAEDCELRTALLSA